MLKEFITQYQWELFQTSAVLAGAIILCMILAKTFPQKEFRHRMVRWIIRLGIVVLVLDLCVAIWHAKITWVQSVTAYTQYLPGHTLILYVSAAGVGCYLLYLWLLRTMSGSSGDDLTARHKIQHIASWAAKGLFCAAAAVIVLAHNGWSNTGTFLGLIGAGVALSMQETLLCVAGWLHIIINRVYDVGDRVEIGGLKGDVINITPTHTQLLEVGNRIFGEQSTGRLLTVPNSTSFRGAVHNYTHGFPFIWVELAIAVTFESNWQKARTLMLEQALEKSAQIEEEVMRNIKNMQDHFAISYRHLTPAVYVGILNNGVQLVLRFLSPTRAKREREHEVSMGILEAIRKEPDITFAYNTTRIVTVDEQGRTEGSNIYTSPFGTPR